MYGTSGDGVKPRRKRTNVSYLLFLDESGHDHKALPYEVHGGIALHARFLWAFVREVGALEQDCFGTQLSRYKTEIKGSKLLDKDRVKWAKQMPDIDPLTRRQSATAYFQKNQAKVTPSRLEFTAYGQACLAMARGIFVLLEKYEARIFACAIPRGAAKKPESTGEEEFLRKDYVFLLERYYYFLEQQQENGLLVMDETEKENDRRFVKRLERYFTTTYRGQQRAHRIVPTPFFVASDMAYPVQVADVCIYCINLGFRGDKAMTGEVRDEIQGMFGPFLHDLQWCGHVEKDGGVFRNYGIVYVPDPYEGRRKKRR